MFFLKKLFLGLGFVFLISLGGAGTQSNSLLMQGIGFIGLLVGLVILYIFARMVWKGLGCLPSFFILSAVVLFMMYALGMFNNGLGGVGNSFIRFLGYKEEPSAAAQESELDEAEENYAKPLPAFGENFPPVNAPDSTSAENVTLPPADQTPTSPDLFAGETSRTSENRVEAQQPKRQNVVGSIAGSLLGSRKNTQEERPFNPNDYPVVYGSVTVITADTLEMYGKYFKIFGIDAPEANQTCADRQGRAYACGREAALWLRGWIQDNELECHVIKQDTKGNMIGTCAYGPYDLGAALVNAGWAVANPTHTDIYTVYELQAQENKRGLWQGSFYKPWDWRKLQKSKPKIKVIRPKQRKTGMFG